MRRISAACRAEHCEASENDRLWESTPPHHQIIVHTIQIIVCTTFGLF